uniref:Uncharacterized protein n=1 Tax=Alexandrium monilatum TaxID=311494 RepID=A0A7S4QAI4_9DINO
MCHLPPPTMDGVATNYCSAPPCPVTCGPDEMHCPFTPPPDCTGDGCVGQDSCAAKSAGCPVTCQPGEHVCHTPAPMPDGMAHNWCSPGHCPVTCDAQSEVHCPFVAPPGCTGDACMGPDSCVDKSTGCPVACQPNEYMCHTPATVPDGTAYNWCSAGFCPVTCADTETHCTFTPPHGCTGDACMGPDFCAPKISGCPATCAPGEHVCTTPPATSDTPAYNWCSAVPCPVTCADDETSCPFVPPAGCTGDACSGAETCVPKSLGCPVACPPNEHICHTPAPMPDGIATNWCSAAACPLTCAADETFCHIMPPPDCTGDACTGTDSCAPKSVGCPVTCQPNEHVCHTPAPTPDVPAHNYCSPSPCPVTCTVNETHCTFMPPPHCTGDACIGPDSCAPKSRGCPVTCQPNEHICHSPAPTPDVPAHNYCSPLHCPVTCGDDELHCAFMPPPGCHGDACSGPDSCSPKATGCPVTCQPNEHKCHMPAPSPEAPAHNYCSPTHCPVTCADDETHCTFTPPPDCTGDACSGPDSCAPKSTGCPVTCRPSENMCHSPPSTPDGIGYNWCSPSPCPVTCASDEVLCTADP